MSRFLAPAVALAAVVLVGALAPAASSDDVRILGAADDGLVLQTVPPRAAAAGARAALAAGFVFSVEPGIYIPGEIGIRLEDDVLCTAGGAELLSRRAPRL